MRFYESANLAQHELSIEERRNADNIYPVTLDTKMRNVETEEFSMTYEKWLIRGNEVSRSARRALLAAGLETGRGKLLDDKDRYEMNVVDPLYELALRQNDWRDGLSPEAWTEQGQRDKEAYVRGKKVYEATTEFHYALAVIQEHHPERTNRTQELAAQAVDAGFVIRSVGNVATAEAA